MAEQSQRKGLDEYRREVAEKADDDKLRSVFRRYAVQSVDVDELLPLARSVLADFLMLRDCEENVPSEQIREQFRKIRDYASKLSNTVHEAYPDTAAYLQCAAEQDTNEDMEFLERGDPFAREDRLRDAATFITALTEWAEAARKAFVARKRGRPQVSLPTHAGDRLAGLYRRLTLRKPTRSSVQSQEWPYGQRDVAEFGSFSKELLALIGMEISEEARKAAIAKIKTKADIKSG